MMSIPGPEIQTDLVPSAGNVDCPRTLAEWRTASTLAREKKEGAVTQMLRRVFSDSG